MEMYRKNYLKERVHSKPGLSIEILHSGTWNV